MPKLLVIADDLTGATDIGAQVANQGVPTIITLKRRPDFSGLYEDHEVVVVDSETRHEDPTVAATTVRSIVTRAIRSGIRSVYKKTDSTLRGNIGAELEAVLQASGRSRLCFVPALPQQGRTTREGIQYVHGVPLHETDFAVDPLNPIQSSRVADILATQTNVSTGAVRVRDLSQEASVEWSDDILIFDAETESDLRRIGKYLEREQWLGAVAGPAGFAQVLPELLGLRRSTVAPPEIHRPVLVVNGSLNGVSLEQIRNAFEIGFHRIQMPPDLLVSRDDPGDSDLNRIANSVGVAFGQNRDCVVCSVVDHEGLAAFDRAGRSVGLSTVDCHKHAARNTGLVIRSLLQRFNVRSLVVFGGDTLMGIARGLGWTEFLARAEILSGLAVVDVVSGDDPTVITKPGGYGDHDLLAQLKTKIVD